MEKKVKELELELKQLKLRVVQMEIFVQGVASGLKKLEKVLRRI